MITINFDPLTEMAKLATPAVILVGLDEGVRIVCSSAPGDDTAWELALGKTSDNSVLAFTDTFSRENTTTWTADLDCTDTRLVTEAAANTAPFAVTIELTGLIGGKRKGAQLSGTVRQRVISGPTTSEGGPVYLTSGEVDTAIAAAMADVPHVNNTGVLQSPSASQFRAANEISATVGAIQGAKFWDDFGRSDRNLLADAAPSGQVWATGNGVALGTHVKIVSGAMTRDDGNVYYPLVNVGADVKIMGARVKWVAGPGGTDFATACFLIVAGTGGIGNASFYHVLFNRRFFSIGTCGPAGFPTEDITDRLGNGSGGAGPYFYPQAELALDTEYVFQFEISGDCLTLRHPQGTVSVNVPGLGYIGGPYAQYEILTILQASDGLSDALQYLSVWANPQTADLPGQTVQPWSSVLDGLMGKTIDEIHSPGAVLNFYNEPLLTDHGFKFNGQVRVQPDNGWVIGGIRGFDGSGTPTWFLGEFQAQNGLYLRMPPNGTGFGIVNGGSTDTPIFFSDGGKISTKQLVVGRTAGVDTGTTISRIKHGVATLVAGTVTVSDTTITTNTRILLTAQSLGTVTVPKALGVTARTAATSFTITSADATDTSVVAYTLIEP